MTQEEIIKGNKLIAFFMGEDVPVEVPYGFSGNTTIAYRGPREVINWEKAKLHYHRSWDWLMSVLDKIESLGYATNIHCYDQEHYCTIKEGNFRRGYGESKSKIEAVWLSCIDFIKCHN